MSEPSPPRPSPERPPLAQGTISCGPELTREFYHLCQETGLGPHQLMAMMLRQTRRQLGLPTQSARRD